MEATGRTSCVRAPRFGVSADFDKQNIGTYRMKLKGINSLGLQPVSMHDIAPNHNTAERRGQDLPVAVTLGNDPVLSDVAGKPART